ncbi:MAG: hypothetical protein QNK37_28540 [Acidobacteriota bacterium]|nr:hypothetical protein [Acidobacteriota bacterium]
MTAKHLEGYDGSGRFLDSAAEDAVPLAEKCMPVFEKSSPVAVSAMELFHYHQSPGAFTRLVPPWQRVETVSVTGGLHDGGIRVMRIRLGPFFLTWVAEHHNVDSGLGFRDVQLKGPFRRWDHQHLFKDHQNGALLVDRVDFLPPPGFPKPMAMMEKLFGFRHRRTCRDLERHAAHAHLRPDRVIFAGKPGRLADSLAAFLSVGGTEVYLLQPQRLTSGRERYVMRPFFGGEPCHPLDGADAVIHTGAPYEGEDANDYLAFLCRALPTLGNPPRLLLHLQGHRPDIERYTRDPVLEPGLAKPIADPGRDARQEWLEQLETCFERVVRLHFGDRVRAPFPALINLLLRLETFLFLAGGAKSPNFRWISGEDTLGAVLHVLCHDSLEGDIAAVAPQPSTRADLQEILVKRGLFSYTFNRMLKVLPWAKPGRPPGLDPALDGMMSLASTGYRFVSPNLAEAVADELGDPPSEN